jgi:PAS domain S-box-containing protein
LAEDENDPLRDWATREKVNGFAGFPLMVGERPGGVLAIFCAGPVHEFAMDAMAVAAREIAMGVERRRADEIIREQAALLDQAQDAILVKDLQDRLVFWNKGAERIYGWPAAEAIGRKATEIIPSDPKAYADAEQRLLEHGSWHGNLVKTARNGGKVTMECRWTLMRNGDGSPKSILAIDADVSGG